MLNQNGVNVNEAYQNQKVQQVKLSDGTIRNLMQYLAQTKNPAMNTTNSSNNNSSSI